MRRVLAVVAVLAAGGCGAPYSAGDFADDDIAAGQAYLAQGDTQRALERFNAAVANEPDYAAGYLMRGQAWRTVGRFGEAVDDFSQAIARGLGNSAYVYVVRAEALAAVGEPARAIADYDHALTLKAAYWPAHAGRGIVLAESGDATRALADLDYAIGHDPRTIKEVLATQRVQRLSRKGPAAHGTKTTTLTFSTQAMLAATYLARGKLRFGQGEYEPALVDLEQALERAPDLAAARLYRGLSYFALGRCMEGRFQFRMLGEQARPSIQAALDEHRAVIAQTECSAETL